MELDQRVAKTLEELAGQMTEALKHCLSIGMVLPFIVSTVSPNGSVYVIRYVEAGKDLRAEPLALHTEESGFALPVNIIIVDQTGQAVLVAINQAGMTFH
jgi:hypothetical protein